MEKLVKSEIEHHMPFMVLDLLYKYQWFACKDRRPNGGTHRHIYWRTWEKLNANALDVKRH